MDLNIANTARFVCTAPRIFDGERVLQDHAVLIENGLVSAVIPQGSLPGDVPVWHEPDCTIIPGLIDTHMHFMRWQGPLFLAQGVTTVRDTGNDLAWILAQRKEWHQNLNPRIYCLGPILDGEDPIHKIVSRRCTNAVDAVAGVRETIAAGVDGIKLYVNLDPEWLPGMVQACHSEGRKASMHCQGSGVLAAGRAGVDEFFHLDGILADVWHDHPAGWLNIWGLPEFSKTWDRQLQVANSIRDIGMTATPTLAYWESQWRIRTPDYLGSEEMRHVPAAVIEWQGTEPANEGAAAQWQRALEAAQRFTGLLFERGVPLLAGSDVPCGALPPGLSLWRELSLLVGAGLSPIQALRAATSTSADFLGQPHLGRLRPGSAADLVWVRGYPTVHIPDKPDIAGVMRQGTVYKQEDLLAASEAASKAESSTVREEPWGVQFALHRG